MYGRTDIRFSFAALAKRGGATGPHRDGWGISFYEGRGARMFESPDPDITTVQSALGGAVPAALCRTICLPELLYRLSEIGKAAKVPAWHVIGLTARGFLARGG